MRARPILALLLSGLLGWIASTASAQLPSRTPQRETDQGFPRIAVGSLVQVTRARPEDEQFELGMCAHPRDAKELAVGIMYYTHGDMARVSEGGRGTAYYVSHDGGLVWQLALDVRDGVDPACAFANDGTLYAATMVPDSVLHSIGPIWLQTSRDRGRSWETVATPTPRGRYLDRQWLAVDNTGGRHAGNLYFNAVEYTQAVRPDSTVAGGNVAADILVFRSEDRGRSMQATLVPGAHTDSSQQFTNEAPGQIVVLSSGTVVSSHLKFKYVTSDTLRRIASSGHRIATSSDGGRTFSTEFSISPPVNEVKGRGVDLVIHTFPMLAVDESRGPFRDRVYAVWPSSVGGRATLWMAHTLDSAARRWTAPEVIDETAATNIDSLWLGPNNVVPAVAVNSQGVVGVSWAARGPAFSPDLTPRFMASADGGETWSRGVDLSARSRLYSLRGRQLVVVPSGTVNGYRQHANGPWSVGIDGAWRGLEAAGHKEPADFWGIAADAAGVFHPMWLDAASGRPAQLWTAAVTVSGSAHALREVTDELRPRFVDWSFDSTTNRLSVDLELENIGTRPLDGPIVVKWVGQPDGPLAATNADNGWAGPGAVWLIQVNRNDGARLAPGQRTARRRLELHVRKPDAGRAAMQVRAFVRAPAREP